MERTNVIVSEKSWHQSMSDHLEAKLGSKFVLIDNPKSLKLDYLERLDPQFVFFPHWSYPISDEIFERFECVIFHMTDLPFGRGGTPLQNLILRGFTDTRVSALRCTKEIDSGPIYLKHDLSLHGSAQEIFERTSVIVEDMICEIVKGNFEPVDQVGDPVIFIRRGPEEGNLARCQNLMEAYDLIRMLDADGYPHAFVEVGDFVIRFRNVSLDSKGLSADAQIVYRTNTDQVKDVQ
jgi:methionyl-tRNA formyltransferase